MSIVIGNKTVAGIHIANKEVQRITIGWKTAYEKGPDYFYINNEYNGLNTITLKKNGSPTTGTTLEWSGDLVTWITVTYNADNEFLIGTPYQNQRIYFRSTDGFSSSLDDYYAFNCSQNYSIGGEIYTLFDYVNRITSLPDYGCRYLCYSSTTLISAEDLKFTGITSIGIHGMRAAFSECSNLSGASPEFPDLTTVNESGFRVGFYHSNISEFRAPNITTVDTYGFSSCFTGSSLTSVDLSNVTTLGTTQPFVNAFTNCSSLSYVVSPNISTWDTTKFSNWLAGVAATGTFVNTGNASIPTGIHGIPSGWVEVMNPDYFRIVNEYAGINTISLTKTGTPTDITLDYSTDNGSTWTTWNSANGNLSVTLAQGERVLFIGDNTRISTNDSNYFTFGGTQNHSIAGDLVTLYDSTGTSNTLPSQCFNRLFLNDTKLVNASNATITATNFENDSCKSLFNGCSNLVSTPILTVNTIGENSFHSTFRDCISLTNVSGVHLNATYVPRGGYKIMFYNTAITTAPEIMATSIYGTADNYENGALSYMFEGCSNMNSITTHIVDWNSGYGTHYWCKSVAATGDFYNLGGATIPTGANGIPSGWTVHTTL